MEKKNYWNAKDDKNIKKVVKNFFSIDDIIKNNKIYHKTNFYFFIFRAYIIVNRIKILITFT